MEKGKELSKKLDAGIETFSDLRIRWLVGRVYDLVEQGKLTGEKCEALLSETLWTEFERHLILVELKSRGPMTIKELSEATGIDKKKIVRHVIALRRALKVTEAGVKDRYYLYSVLEGEER